MKILLFLFSVFLIILPGLNRAEETPEIRVAILPGNVGLAMVKMMDQPAGAGYTAQFELFKAPDLSVAKLISDAIDIAGLPTSTAAMMYNKGADVRIVAIIGWGVLYLVGSDPSLKKWADLKNKEIQVPNKGTVPDLLLRYLLAQNGLQFDRDVKIQYLASPVELAQLIASDRVPLAVLPEPWVTEVLARNPRLRVLLDFQKEWKRVEKQGRDYPQTCLVVRNSFAQTHPRVLKAFLAELEQSIRWVNRHPREGGDLAQKHLQIPALAAEKGLRRANLKYRSAVDVRPEIDRFLQRLFEMAPESMGGTLPDEGFYYKP